MMHTMINGVIKQRSPSIIAVFAAKSVAETPVTAEKVTSGIPTDPKAVGVVFATKHAITVAKGFNPIAASIDAGIATAVPNPAIPSIKLPNPHPIINIKTLLSIETSASICFMESIAPVRKIRL
ncbi:hypothetical protein D3C76_785860 [compost metagenome]